MKKQKTPPVADDPIYQVTKIVRDAWSWLILREAIFYNVTRFNEFQQNLGIARSTLATSLERLATGGVFERRTLTDDENSFEYILTDKGRDFFGWLVAAMRWGNDWVKSPVPDDIKVIHINCEKRLKAAFRCSECEQPLKARDVRVDSVSRATSDLIKEHRQRTPDLELLERVRPSSIARTLKIFGDRWTMFVIRECFLGTRRFDDFLGRLGIASNILAQRLERLVAHGILTKSVYKPSRHEYRLTKKGLDFYPIPLASLNWGNRWSAKSRAGLTLTHKPCGRRFDAMLTCERCSQPVKFSDVKFVEIQKSDTDKPSSGAKRRRQKLVAVGHAGHSISKRAV